MAFFKDLSKRSKLPMPGGTAGKYSTAGKTGLALAGVAPAMGDPEVTGARGSAKNIGLSVDQEKQKKMGDAADQVVAQKAAAAAAEAAAEEPYTLAKESQRKQLMRKGRRASILTSSQGAYSPLGIPG